LLQNSISNFAFDKVNRRQESRWKVRKYAGEKVTFRKIGLTRKGLARKDEIGS